MAPKAAKLTVGFLKSLLTQIGSATGGRKDVLLSRLAQDLNRPRLTVEQGSNKTMRILSIDMGIKNLAFCIADVKCHEPVSKQDNGIEMSVAAWRRLDVAQEVSRLQTPPTRTASDAVEDEDSEDPYTPAALSRTAFNLLQNTLLPYNPDLILIERQRWRSGGGSAVQQWTVRVNTLEGMLWAILTALRAEPIKSGKSTASRVANRHDYQIFGVDPKRVGNFWVGDEVKAKTPKRSTKLDDELLLGPDGELEEIVGGPTKAAKTLSRGQVEKKARIKLVRSWLDSHESMSTAPTAQDPDDVLLSKPLISFSFSEDADLTRQLLCATSYAKERKRSTAIGVSRLKKLDDFTDCFLQAVAWVAWEQNRRMIAEKWSAEEGQ
ncbi:mitochondrial resolvase Ydc2 [Clohesyomyces aquaticus]|uniref:Mitochondrial resolvase Ydc2 n=1 Tax=Clohesyomyces aquaticus TaxID=1231657 RepID=A0A1Y1ZGU6_9PLEO|nr:mitochondrial resolvase Ydc2 [Clohesyomyces aquaticus]